MIKIGKKQNNRVISRPLLKEFHRFLKEERYIDLVSGWKTAKDPALLQKLLKYVSLLFKVKIAASPLYQSFYNHMCFFISTAEFEDQQTGFQLTKMANSLVRITTETFLNLTSSFFAFSEYHEAYMIADTAQEELQIELYQQSSQQTFEGYILLYHILYLKGLCMYLGRFQENRILKIKEAHQLISSAIETAIMFKASAQKIMRMKNILKLIEANSGRQNSFSQEVSHQNMESRVLFPNVREQKTLEMTESQNIRSFNNKGDGNSSTLQQSIIRSSFISKNQEQSTFHQESKGQIRKRLNNLPTLDLNNKLPKVPNNRNPSTRNFQLQRTISHQLNTDCSHLLEPKSDHQFNTEFEGDLVLNQNNRTQYSSLLRPIDPPRNSPINNRNQEENHLNSQILPQTVSKKNRKELFAQRKYTYNPFLDKQQMHLESIQTESYNKSTELEDNENLAQKRKTGKLCIALIERIQREMIFLDQEITNKKTASTTCYDTMQVLSTVEQLIGRRQQLAYQQQVMVQQQRVRQEDLYRNQVMEQSMAMYNQGQGLPNQQFLQFQSQDEKTDSQKNIGGFNQDPNISVIASGGIRGPNKSPGLQEGQLPANLAHTLKQQSSNFGMIIEDVSDRNDLEEEGGQQPNPNGDQYDIKIDGHDGMEIGGGEDLGGNRYPSQTNLLKKDGKLDMIFEGLPSETSQRKIIQVIPFPTLEAKPEDSISIDSDTLPLKKVKRWEMSVYNYRNKTNPQFVTSNSLVLVQDFDLDIHEMLLDFKSFLGDSVMSFYKRLQVLDRLYVIELKIRLDKDNQLLFEVDPKHEEPSEDQEEEGLKKDILYEKEFINLISKISVVEKLLPIDSIYTLGSFLEIVSKFLMPSLNIQEVDQEVDTKQMINLEVWPIDINILYTQHNEAPDRLTTNWYHHMYDNNIRLFIHLMDESEENQVSYPSLILFLSLQDCKLRRFISFWDADPFQNFTSVPIDIAVGPNTFKNFFICTEPQDEELPEILEELQSLNSQTSFGESGKSSSQKDLPDSEEEEREKLFLSFQEKLFALMILKRRYRLVGGKDEGFSDSFGHAEEEQTTIQQYNLDVFIDHSIKHVISIYEKSQISLFSPEYYMTYVSMRVWLNFNRFLVFLLHDNYVDSEVSVYSKVVYLQEDMEEESSFFDCQVYVIPYNEIDVAFCSKLRVLEWENRKIFYKFLIDSFLVADATQKAISEMMAGSEDEPSPISINQYNPESVYSSSFYVKNTAGYLVLFRVTMIAFNAVPLGFKVEKYKICSTKVDQIAFLIIHPHVWRRDQNIEPNEAENEKTDFDVIHESFYLFEYLEAGGSERLIKNVKAMIQGKGLADNSEEEFLLDTVGNYLQIIGGAEF